MSRNLACGSVFALHDSDQVNDWTPYARKSGIQVFNVVDLDLCDLITIDQAAARRMVNPSGITVQSMQVGVP